MHLTAVPTEFDSMVGCVLQECSDYSCDFLDVSLLEHNFVATFAATTNLTSSWFIPQFSQQSSPNKPDWMASALFSAKDHQSCSTCSLPAIYTVNPSYTDHRATPTQLHFGRGWISFPKSVRNGQRFAFVGSSTVQFPTRIRAFVDRDSLDFPRRTSVWQTQQ